MLSRRPRMAEETAREAKKKGGGGSGYWPPGTTKAKNPQPRAEITNVGR